MKALFIILALLYSVNVCAQDDNTIRFIEKRKDPNVAALWSGFINFAGLAYTENIPAAAFFLAQETYIDYKLIQGLKRGDNVDNYYFMVIGFKAAAMMSAHIYAKKYNEKLKAEIGIAMIDKTPGLNLKVQF